MVNALKATIGCRFALLAMLVDEDTELDSIFTEFNKVVTDTSTEHLCKQCQKKAWVTDEILEFCDQRRDLKERDELEGAKDYKRLTKGSGKTRKWQETLIEGQCQEVEACLRKQQQQRIPAIPYHGEIE